mgnify:CR=1 FL=1
MLPAFAAAVSSAIWALIAEKSSLPTVVAAIALTGCAALAGTLVAAVVQDQPSADINWTEAAILALIVVACQLSTYTAFAADGAASLAVVNCNIVVIVAHKIATADTVSSQTLGTAAAAVIYVALGAYVAYSCTPKNAQINV